MRQYILTSQEKKVIKKYIDTGERPDGFRMLLSRCRHMQTINEDLTLIKQFLEKTAKQEKATKP